MVSPSFIYGNAKAGAAQLEAAQDRRRTAMIEKLLKKGGRYG